MWHRPCGTPHVAHPPPGVVVPIPSPIPSRGRLGYRGYRLRIRRWEFQKLDSWIRMRLRCMKVKRKNYNDNRKLRLRFFRGKLGLLALEEFCTRRDGHGQVCRVTPRGYWAPSVGVAR